MFIKSHILKKNLTIDQVLQSVQRRRVSPVKRMERFVSNGISLLADDKAVARSLVLFSKAVKLAKSLYPTRPLVEFYLKSEISLGLFNNGFKTLSADYLRDANEVCLHEIKSVKDLKLFTLYQNLCYLHYKQEEFEIAEFYEKMAFEIMEFQSVELRVKFLLSLIFFRLSEKKPEESLKLCYMAKKYLKLLKPTDLNAMQVRLFTVSSLKGMNKMDLALNELMRCVDMLDNNPSMRKLAFIKLTFLSLTDVYVSLNQAEDAINAIISGGQMLEPLEEPDLIHDYYKEAWEFVSDLPASSQMIKVLESSNLKVHGSSIQAADLYSTLSKHFYFMKNYEEAAKYRHKMLSIYKKNNIKEFYFDTYSIISSLYLKFDLKLAHTYITICDKMVKSNQPNSSTHIVNMLWFKYYKSINDSENATKYFNRYLDSCPDSKSRTSKLIDDYLDYGDFISSKNKYEESVKAYSKALELSDQLKMKKNQTRSEVLESLGAVYRKMRKHDSSLDCLFKSFEGKSFKHETESESESEKSGRVYHELMATYLSMHEYQIALHYAIENLKVLESDGLSQNYNSAVTCYNIGFVYEKLLDRSRAIEFYSKAKKIFLSLQDHEQVRNLMENIRALE